MFCFPQLDSKSEVGLKAEHEGEYAMDSESYMEVYTSLFSIIAYLVIGSSMSRV